MGLGSLTVLLAASAGSCADLTDLDRNRCGNSIVELGEACDDSSEHCGRPGTEGACRWLCQDAEDCPKGSGWACAQAGVCERWDGSFDEARLWLAEDVLQLAVADFDGDSQQRDDVLAVSRFALNENGVSTSAYSIAFADAGRLGSPDVRRHIVYGHASIGVSDLGGDGHPDLTVLTEREHEPEFSYLASTPRLSVEQPRADKTVRSALLTSVVDLPSDARLGVMSLSGFTQAVIFSGTKVFSPYSLTPDATLFTLDGDAEDIVGEPRLANFAADSAGDDDLAVAYRGDDRVYVYASPFEPAGPFEPVTLGVTTIERLWIDHATGDDAYLDLVVSGANGRLYVAYGCNDGRFRSTPDLDCADEVDQAFGGFPGNIKASIQPLAVARLDGDDLLDVVYPQAMLLSVGNSSGSCEIIGSFSASYGSYDCTFFGESWLQLVTGDLNLDGRTDLAGSTAEDPLLVTYSVSDDTFAAIPVPLSEGALVGPLTMANAGADLAADLVFSRHLDPERDALSVAHSSEHGTFEPPVTLGELDRIVQIEAVAPSDPTGPTFGSPADQVIVLSEILGEDGDASGGRAFTPLFEEEGGEVVLGRCAVGLPARAHVVPGHFLPSGPSLASVWLRHAVDNDFGPALEGCETPTDVLGGFLATAPAEDPDTPLHVRRLGSSVDLPSGPEWNRGLVVAADLDGDAIDELVLIAPGDTDGESPATLLVATAKNVASRREFAFELGEPRELPVRLRASEEERAKILAVRREDDDATPDLALLDADARLVLLGNRGVGAFEPDDVRAVEGPEGETIRDFAFDDLNLDGALDVLLATDTGVHVGTIDEATSKLVPLTLPGEQQARESTRIEGLPPAHRIATGRIGGSGLVDVVLATTEGVLVYTARLRAP